MNIFYKMLPILLVSALVSCNSDNDNTIDSNEIGKAQLFFDYTVAGDKMLLNTSFYSNSNQEQIQISRLNYIVSNIRLNSDNGNVYVYPKDKSYFIIDSEKGLQTIDLEGIPAGNYTSITLGLGVDQAKYLKGEADQQAFWDLAATHDMTWSWITGYKFINFEGVFKSAKVDGTPKFSLHIGSHGTALDNYKEITLVFPNSARVRANIKPSIHFMVDAGKLLDGSNKMPLINYLNPAGTTASIMVSAIASPMIMKNATEMFTIDHVHNSGESH